MRFYVVDPTAPEVRSDPQEATRLADAPSISSVMWLPLPRELDPTQIEPLVANTAPSVLRSDVVALGLHAAHTDKASATHKALCDVAQRIGDSPLLLVHMANSEPRITHFGGDRVDGLESSATLESIRELDVADVVRRPGGELPRHPSFHYEGPNRAHYEAFLRPGFGARSIEELDRLAFWLAPMLRGRKCLLVDNWTMIGVAYHVGQYLASLGESGGTRVASLRGYDEHRDLLTRRLKNVFGPVEPESGAVLVSVNSSGRLVSETLLPTMVDVGFQEPLGIALTRTRRPPTYELPALTTLSDDFMGYLPKDCPACAGGKSTLIPIQHDSYQLSLAAYTHKTTITRAIAEPSTGVIERYKSVAAFQIHRTYTEQGHTNSRHHAYFVDLAPVLAHDEFRSRLREKLQPWLERKIDLVLHPRHDVAGQLAAMVSDELGGTRVVACDERDLPQLNTQDRDRIGGARRICLVDDVVISGARVLGYRRAITSFRRDQASGEYELYCLVGCARPPSERVLRSVTDVVHHSEADPRFVCVECLYLPEWAEEDCRWCAELRVLNELPREVRNRPAIRERLQVLESRDGLVDELFLPWGKKGARDRFWELGPGSVFGDVQGSDLALSVAAAMQSMRGGNRRRDGTWAESKLDEVFRSPVAKVLDPNFYLRGRYYEPVIVASILRAAKVHDVRAPGSGLNLRKSIDTLAAEELSTELHGELLLAARLGQLPRTAYRLSVAHPDIAAVARGFFLP